MSAAYDWMKLSPHGASVVPMVAVANAMASRERGRVGATVPCRAAPQSGPAMIPARM